MTGEGVPGNHDSETPGANNSSKQQHAQVTRTPSQRPTTRDSVRSNACTARREHPIARRNQSTFKNARPHNDNPGKSAPRPQFSLAGNASYQNQGQSFIDPGYYDLNPKYNEVENKPVWGLAKPLPRVVRPGMQRAQRKDGDGVYEDKRARKDQPGSSEAIPQLGMIGGQREDAGKERNDEGRHTQQPQGYGEQLRGKSYRTHTASERHSVNRVDSSYSIVGRYGSPGVEREDPLEKWKSRGSYHSRDQGSEAQDGDIGVIRVASLATVPERPSASPYGASSSSAETASIDKSHVDLEAGYGSGDWPAEEENEIAEISGLDDRAEIRAKFLSPHNRWAAFREIFREPLAECLATMIAVLIGLCTNLAVQTSTNTAGNYQSTNWAWGLGVTVGIYVAGGISGGHLNPAISVVLSVFRGFPPRKALTYIAAQVLGGILAGFIAYGLYRDAILHFDAGGGQNALVGGSTAAVGLYDGGTGKSFFSQPAQFVGPGSAFANEFVATAILACAILALGDDSNAPPGAGMHALIVGLVITVLTMAFGYNTGPCLNPARDLGPRIATAVLGYGGQVFTVENTWWIYGAWCATITGGLVGGLLYDGAIFVGGESPVNYPRGKRKAKQRVAKLKAKRRWWGWKRRVESGGKEVVEKTGRRFGILPRHSTFHRT